MKRKYLLSLLNLLLLCLIFQSCSCTGGSSPQKNSNSSTINSSISNSSSNSDVPSGKSTYTESQNNDNKGIIVKQITLPYIHCNSPQIIGDEIYICVNDHSKSMANKLISYNIKTSKISTIFESKYEKPSLQRAMCNKDWLIWLDSNDFGSECTIYSKNIHTGEIRAIYKYKDKDGKAVLVSPYLYNNYVAWVQYDNGIFTVSLYNLDTNSRKTVGTLNKCSFYNSFVYMNDNTLLWTDCINDSGVYCLYDLTSGKLTTIKAPYKYPGYAKLAKNKIYSINFDNYSSWRSQSFGVYDISNKTYKKLSNEYINMFSINNNSVAIMGSKNKFILYDDHNLLNLVDIKLPVEYIDRINFCYDGSLILTQDTPPFTNLILISNY